jgi:hypothetical protein
MPPQVKTTRTFALFEFQPPRLSRNRSPFREFVQGRFEPSVAGLTVTDLGNGLMQEMLYDPRSNATITRRGHAVETFKYGFTAPGGQQFNGDECSATDGL